MKYKQLINAAKKSKNAYVGVGLALEAQRYRVDSPRQIQHVVLATVCAAFDITPDMLRQRTRQRDVVVPRHMYYYFMVSSMYKSGLKLVQIARSLDPYRVHHATVIHAYKQIKELAAHDNYYGHKVMIQEKLKEYGI